MKDLSLRIREKNVNPSWMSFAVFHILVSCCWDEFSIYENQNSNPNPNLYYIKPGLGNMKEVAFE